MKKKRNLNGRRPEMPTSENGQIPDANKDDSRLVSAGYKITPAGTMLLQHIDISTE